MTSELDAELVKKVNERVLKKAFDSIDLAKEFPLKNKGVIVSQRDNWVDSEVHGRALNQLQTTE